MRMLDLFCGRFGWGQSFAERGWEVVGIDVTAPPDVPNGCALVLADILLLKYQDDVGFWIDVNGIPHKFLGHFDFVCASSSCEEFSLYGMAHFHPNPPYPSMGIKLFNHTRELCEKSGVKYIMENTNRAQDFVGNAVNHAGPFYLWGNSVPPLMPMGIKKGIKHAEGFRKDMNPEEKRLCRLKDTMLRSGSKSKMRKEHTAKAATIPAELANCVADYAERICDNR